jgi:hypothetical protein
MLAVGVFGRLVSLAGCGGVKVTKGRIIAVALHTDSISAPNTRSTYREDNGDTSPYRFASIQHGRIT